MNAPLSPLPDDIDSYIDPCAFKYVVCFSPKVSFDEKQRLKFGRVSDKAHRQVAHLASLSDITNNPESSIFVYKRGCDIEEFAEEISVNIELGKFYSVTILQFRGAVMTNIRSYKDSKIDIETTEGLLRSFFGEDSLSGKLFRPQQKLGKCRRPTN